jgi:phosphomannomutase
MSKLMLSVSGMRGVVGDTLDPLLVVKMGNAFGRWAANGTVVVGGDTRPSHAMVKSAVIAGLTSAGASVIDIGIVPTPTVQQAVRFHGAAGGVVVTASHNPEQWNGIKLMNASGSFLEPDEYDAVMSAYAEESLLKQSWDHVGAVTLDSAAISRHVDVILSALDCGKLPESKLRVLIDVNHGAAAVADPILFQKLGVSVDFLESEPDGRFAHEPEPLEKNLSALCEAMRSGNYDIGFAQDPDADRLVIVDEKGRFIGEDYSLGLCIDYILQTVGGQSPQVVVNLSTSRVIEDIVQRYGGSVSYTKIGEAHVTQGLKKRQAVVGGEGNGGVIYPKVGWGRDSLVGIVIALKYLAESGKSVSEIVSEYPSYVMLREKQALATPELLSQQLDTMKRVFSDGVLDLQDGVKSMYSDSWIHLRPSNTEPIVRIFVEAPTVEAARVLLDRAIYA